MKNRLEAIKKKFRNIQPRLLGIHLLVTLAYPVARALISERTKLLIFTDSLTVTGGVLIIAGIVYNLYLHGDFDISAFLLRRGAARKKEEPQSYETVRQDRKEKREAAFNYPLFLGLLYVAVSLILAYTVV